MRNEKKAYFQYYETFEKIVQKFDTPEERDTIRSKIINYGLFGTEPDALSEKENLVWDIVKDMIDDQVHRREINRQNREKRREQNKTNYNDEERKETKQKEIEPKKEVKRFIKPTLQEVKDYCTSRHNGLNAEQFLDYYEARGWKIGKNSMKDWKAAVRTWEQRRTESLGYTNGVTQEWPEDKLTL